MNRQLDENALEDTVQGSRENQNAQNFSHVKQPRYLLIAWILLILLGVFFLFDSVSDLVADG